MGRKPRRHTPTPAAAPVVEAKIWRTKDAAPLPEPEDLVPGRPLAKIHGAVLLLDGSFKSWLFDTESGDTIEASVDALLARFPSTTFAWLGSILIINDQPLPEPSLVSPPTAIPPPYTPERPFP